MLINITLQDPVKARQLFPREPEFIGECDACQYGIVGVWLHGPGLTNPVVWRLLLPEDMIITAKEKKRKYLHFRSRTRSSSLPLHRHRIYLPFDAS